MVPVRFTEAYEHALQPGDNPNCGELPFVLALDPNTPGPVVLVSCWKLSEHELAAVKDTGVIYVGVSAHPERPTQPPFYAIGVNPFTEFGKESFVKLSRTYDPREVPKPQKLDFTRDHLKKVFAQLLDGLCDIGEQNIAGFPGEKLRALVGDYVNECDDMLFEKSWETSKLVPDDRKGDLGPVSGGTRLKFCSTKPKDLPPTECQDLPNMTDHLFNQRNTTE